MLWFNWGQFWNQWTKCSMMVLRNKLDNFFCLNTSRKDPWIASNNGYRWNNECSGLMIHSLSDSPTNSDTKIREMLSHLKITQKVITTKSWCPVSTYNKNRREDFPIIYNKNKHFAFWSLMCKVMIMCMLIPVMKNGDSVPTT